MGSPAGLPQEKPRERSHATGRSASPRARTPLRQTCRERDFCTHARCRDGRGGGEGRGGRFRAFTGVTPGPRTAPRIVSGASASALCLVSSLRGRPGGSSEMSVFKD